MAIDNDNYQKAIRAAKQLPADLQKKLIDELAREMESSVAPLPLIGLWPGVSISAEEIDEARRECWHGFEGSACR